MIYHKQEFIHDPANGVYGDCQRAVIAALLELPMSDVPNFNEGDPTDEDFNRYLDEYLASKGLGRVGFTLGGDVDGYLDAARQGGAFCSVGQVYCLVGESPRSTQDAPANHVVVCCDGKVIYDPHGPTGGGLIGPCIGNRGWYVEVITTRFNPENVGNRKPMELTRDALPMHSAPKDGTVVLAEFTFSDVLHPIRWEKCETPDGGLWTSTWDHTLFGPYARKEANRRCISDDDWLSDSPMCWTPMPKLIREW